MMKYIIISITIVLFLFSVVFAASDFEVTAKNTGENTKEISWNKVDGATKYSGTIVDYNEKETYFTTADTKYILTPTDNVWKIYVDALDDTGNIIASGKVLSFEPPSTGGGTPPSGGATSGSGKPVVIGAPFPGCDCGDYCNLPQYIRCLYIFVTQVAGLLAIMMVIFGGYKYITSSGNPGAIKEAKEIVIGSIVGLVVLLLGYLILNTIQSGIVG